MPVGVLEERANRAEPLVQAAERLYSARGYRPVPLSALARDLGLAEQEVYNYVGSEESLYLTCHRRAQRALQETLDEVSSTAASQVEQLYGCLISILEFIDKHRAGYAELAERSPHHSAMLAADLQSIRRQTIRLISQLLTEAREARGVDPGLVNTETTAAAIYGGIQGVSEWWRANPETSAEDLAARFGRTLWLGVSGMLEREPDADSPAPAS